MNEKSRLRSALIARRDALPESRRRDLAATLTAGLVALPEYARARSVLATMSIGSEWSTREFLERARADGKAVVLPRIAGKPKRLHLHRVPDLSTDLVPGIWDIPEPNPERCPEVTLADIDFALVPALAVDGERFRLGYGAGYFDKLLAGRGSRPHCVTALPSEFLVEELPHEPHDVPVDLVMSERGREAPAGSNTPR
jgi:5-formyltetrahydrofolate cyclo-ligase